MELDGTPSRLDSGGVVVSWVKLSPVQARGIITAYQIDFTEVGAAGGVRRKRQENCMREQCVLEEGQTRGCCQVGADQSEATIAGLDSGKTYNVSVSAINGAGIGKNQSITIEGEFFELLDQYVYI